VTRGRTKIVYIKIPAKLESYFSSIKTPDWSFDRDVPLPVELAENAESVAGEDLSVESLVSAMLSVIASGESEHLFYYRNFVLAVRPGILSELSGAAISKAKNGDFDDARNIISILKGIFPVSGEVLFLAAVIFEEEAEAKAIAGADEEAAMLENRAALAYREALSADIPHPNALFNAAFFSMKTHDFSRAREYFKEYIAGSSDSEKRKLAKRQLEIIEKRELDDENYHAAYTLIKNGEEERGMNELRPYLERHSDVWNGWFLLGWALRRLGRWKDGEAAFRKTLELGGDISDARNELAICLIEQKKLDEAKRELETALSGDTENIKIISNLGVLCQKMGDFDAAEAFFRTALELQSKGGYET
jgi:Flp pilus assembly protein TadD